MTDIMRRIALEEPMSEDEQAQANYCVAHMDLYPLLNAAFALAEQQGLTLAVNIKRPQPRRRRRA